MKRVKRPFAAGARVYQVGAELPDNHPAVQASPGLFEDVAAVQQSPEQASDETPKEEPEEPVETPVTPEETPEAPKRAARRQKGTKDADSKT